MTTFYLNRKGARNRKYPVAPYLGLEAADINDMFQEQIEETPKLSQTQNNTGVGTTAAAITPVDPPPAFVTPPPPPAHSEDAFL